MFFIRRFKRYLRRRELNRLENRITFLEEHLKVWTIKLNKDACVLQEEANMIANWNTELILARKRHKHLLGF